MNGIADLIAPLDEWQKCSRRPSALEYSNLIVAGARTTREPVVLVAQSLGGFSAPLASTDVAVERIVLVSAMIPLPGETAGEWWDAVGWREAAQASAERDGRPEPDVTDLHTLFFHDLPADLVEIMQANRCAWPLTNRGAVAEGPAVFSQPWPLAAWPELSTTVLCGREDRLFPIDLQRRIARERLGLDGQELPGGHLLALGQPSVVADRMTGRGQSHGPVSRVLSRLTASADPWICDTCGRRHAMTGVRAGQAPSRELSNSSRGRPGPGVRVRDGQHCRHA